MQRENQERLAHLYIGSRIFEEFRDNVCLAIQDGNLPPIRSISVDANGVCQITESDGETFAYSFGTTSWVKDLKEPVLALMRDVSQKLERDKEYLESCQMERDSIASLYKIAEQTISAVKGGSGIAVEKYKKELLRTIGRGYRQCGIKKVYHVDFSFFQMRAIEMYGQASDTVIADAEAAKQRTDSLVKVLVEDIEILKLSEGNEPESMPLREMAFRVVRDIHHLKDNFTIVSGEIDNGDPEISEQRSILQARSEEIAKDIFIELAEHDMYSFGTIVWKSVKLIIFAAVLIRLLMWSSEMGYRTWEDSFCMVMFAGLVWVAVEVLAGGFVETKYSPGRVMLFVILIGCLTSLLITFGFPWTNPVPDRLFFLLVLSPLVSFIGLDAIIIFSFASDAMEERMMRKAHGIHYIEERFARRACGSGCTDY